jgi:hypothetical protein
MMDIDLTLSRLKMHWPAAYLPSIDYETAIVPKEYLDDAVQIIEALRQQLADQTSGEPIGWLLKGNVGCRYYEDYEEANKWMALDGLRGKVELIEVFDKPQSVEVLLEALRKANVQIGQIKHLDGSNVRLNQLSRTIIDALNAYSSKPQKIEVFDGDKKIGEVDITEPTAGEWKK